MVQSESSELVDGIKDDVTFGTIWGPILACFPVLILRKSVA